MLVYTAGMRLIMLDTETTGLSPQSGDRMVEIGAIEVCQRRILPEKKFHHYINPGRSIPNTVVRIHGIDDEQVKDCPHFKDIAEEFVQFIEGATLVIHNAPFDLGFIMYELAELGLPNIEHVAVLDTLVMARKRFPHQRNTLDALCDRYAIERGHRTLHGALLDAELLAEMYLAMTGGSQFSLTMPQDEEAKLASDFVQLPEKSSASDERMETSVRPRRPILSLNDSELAAHELMMQRIKKDSGGSIVWETGDVL